MEGKIRRMGMSTQLDLLERDLSQQLYSMRGWMGRMQNKLDRVERLQEFIVDYKQKVKEHPDRPKVVQMDMCEAIQR
jgi:hypothetical protein